jgi:hypothetical protein
MPQPIISPAATQPVRSVADYTQEQNALDLQRQQMGANALNFQTGQMNLQDRQRGLQEAQTIRNALASLGPNATPEARISAMEGTNLQQGYAAADVLRKAMLDKRKVEAQAIKDEEDARQNAVKTGRLKLQYGIKSLQSAKGPADAIAAIDNGVLQGYWDKAYADQLKAGVPQQEGPEFDSYKLRELKSIMDADKLLESHDRSLTRNQADTHFNRTAGLTEARDAATAAHQQNQDAVARGNLAVNQGRLAIDTAAPKGVVLDTEDGPMIVDLRSGEGRAITAGGKPVAAKIDANTKKELTSIGQQESVIQGAIAAVKANPSAFSFQRGLGTKGGDVSESLVGRLDSSAERQARSYIFNNVSKIINERAGAAQSAQEMARLRSFLPADTDSDEQIVDKLNGYLTYLGDLRKGTSPAKAGVQGGATGDFGDAEIDAAIARKTKK